MVALMVQPLFQDDVKVCRYEDDIVVYRMRWTRLSCYRRSRNRINHHGNAHVDRQDDCLWLPLLDSIEAVTKNKSPLFWKIYHGKVSDIVVSCKDIVLSCKDSVGHRVFVHYH